MIDVDKQVAYWQAGAREDWAVANDRLRPGLFFAQLALEEALKALVCRQTRDLPPRIHNLARLVELAALNPSAEQIDVLAEMTAFNLEGRYPGALARAPAAQEAQRYLERAKG